MAWRGTTSRPKCKRTGPGLREKQHRSEITKLIASSIRAAGCGKLEESFGHFRAFAGLLVLKEYKGFAPRLLPETIDPTGELGISIIGSSQAQITPIGCGRS